jgi:acyl carrier protein
MEIVILAEINLSSVQWVIYLLVPLIVFFIFLCIFVRKRELREVEKFNNGQKLEDDIYLKNIGLHSNAEDARNALFLRSIIANLAKIPTQTIQPKHRLWKDYDRLPFFDSPDTVEFIMEVEDKLNVSIPDEYVEKIVGTYDENLTVQEFTLNLIACLQKIKNEHEGRNIKSS